MIHGEDGRPIYEQIRDRLYNMIHAQRLTAGHRLPTEAELCTELGVSRTSVRKAVKGLVEAGYLRRIPGKGTYIRDSISLDARSVERHETTIAFVENEHPYDVKFYSNHVWQVLYRTLQARLGKLGFTHFMSQMLSSESGSNTPIVQNLLSKADIVILAELIDQSLIRTLLSDSSTRVLLVEPSVDIDGIDSISFHNQGIGRQACSYLHGLGHRTIGCICGPEERKPARHRRMGFLERARQLGLGPESTVIEAGDWSVQAGYDAARRIRARSNGVTAVFCANDFMALGAANALFEDGARIPAEISIVGVDDALPERSLPFGLTTFRFPIDAVTQLIADRIGRLVNGSEEPVTHVFFEATLVERDSCGPPRGFR